MDIKLKHHQPIVTGMQIRQPPFEETRGMRKKVVFVCDSLEQAEIVFSNLKATGDYNYVRINLLSASLLGKIRRSKTGRFILSEQHVQTCTPELQPTWYKSLTPREVTA